MAVFFIIVFFSVYALYIIEAYPLFLIFDLSPVAVLRFCLYSVYLRVAGYLSHSPVSCARAFPDVQILLHAFSDLVILHISGGAYFLHLSFQIELSAVLAGKLAPVPAGTEFYYGVDTAFFQCAKFRV